ncbi:MAG: hypothetical protein IPN62_02585 [Flavobacteriales bacterium]|nr:hypothetical protein [Flavobacteriales bacterium]
MKLIIQCSFLLLPLLGQAQVNKVAGNFSHGTECMGVEGDGSQTVKAYGNGRHRWDAIEQARKNAVRDVIFNGLREGKPECEQRPVVPEVNARQKYEKYFNTFFADDGPYKEFVSTEDERLAERVRRDKTRGRESVSHAFIVRVLRPELKARLIADGILEQ